MFGFGLPTIRCVYIPILNDECLEEELEDFSVELSSEQDCVMFVNSTANITIYDDDSKLSLSIINYACTPSINYYICTCACMCTHTHTHTHTKTQ